WPWDDNNTGYVRVHAIPNIGKWNEFTSAKLEKLQKKDIQKPNPQVSQHSVPKSPWFVPMPHKSIDQLKTQLTNRGVSYNNESTKQDLISLLNNKLSQEPELQKTGWALKENQKFGKRGGGKRISKHVITYLEGYFLAGNINKSDHYTTEEMHTELLELVKISNLEESDVPKVSTIQNWIGRYATQHKQKLYSLVKIVFFNK
ncbi:17075_t:CDS:2, partial [Dentiscutata erythropus]